MSIETTLSALILMPYDLEAIFLGAETAVLGHCSGCQIPSELASWILSISSTIHLSSPLWKLEKAKQVPVVFIYSGRFLSSLHSLNQSASQSVWWKLSETSNQLATVVSQLLRPVARFGVSKLIPTPVVKRPKHAHTVLCEVLSSSSERSSKNRSGLLSQVQAVQPPRFSILPNIWLSDLSPILTRASRAIMDNSLHASCIMYASWPCCINMPSSRFHTLDRKFH